MDYESPDEGGPNPVDRTSILEYSRNMHIPRYTFFISLKSLAQLIHQHTDGRLTTFFFRVGIAIMSIEFFEGIYQYIVILGCH